MVGRSVGWSVGRSGNFFLSTLRPSGLQTRATRRAPSLRSEKPKKLSKNCEEKSGCTNLFLIKIISSNNADSIVVKNYLILFPKSRCSIDHFFNKNSSNFSLYFLHKFKKRPVKSLRKICHRSENSLCDYNIHDFFPDFLFQITDILSAKQIYNFLPIDKKIIQIEQIRFTGVPLQFSTSK